MDVMAHPSSVITQVSRDEEASKAAPDRGESLFSSHSKKKKKNNPKTLANSLQLRNLALACLVAATQTF